MNTQTEMEIRAQSMINSLSQQRMAALDQVVYGQAELAIKDARIKELEDQVMALMPKPTEEASAA